VVLNKEVDSTEEKEMAEDILAIINVFNCRVNGKRKYKIKKSEKGLSVLWGERGTGKTSIINYLADKLDRIVIFIPNNLIEHTINNPDFMTKHYKNCRLQNLRCNL
jgi:putative ribosome biogenesis GTPase RsgA